MGSWTRRELRFYMYIYVMLLSSVTTLLGPSYLLLILLAVNLDGR